MLSIVTTPESDWVARYVKQCRTSKHCSAGYPLFIAENADLESSIELHKLPQTLPSPNYQMVKLSHGGKVLDLSGILPEFAQFVSGRMSTEPTKQLLQDQARVWLNAYLHNIPLRKDIVGYHYDGCYIFPSQAAHNSLTKISTKNVDKSVLST